MSAHKGLLCSQVGYDLGHPMRVLVCGDAATVKAGEGFLIRREGAAARIAGHEGWGRMRRFEVLEDRR